MPASMLGFLVINIFIINLRVLSVGCNVSGCYIGCLMYADDLILLSATVNGLQAMLNCCFSTSTELRLQFNCSKSTCTAICPGAPHSISDMQLGSNFIVRGHRLLDTLVSLSLVETTVG